MNPVMRRHPFVRSWAAVALVAATAAAPRSPYLSEKGPVIGPHASQLDSLIPGASGICLVEVTKLREEDTRDSDGDLVQIVELKPVRGTGITTGGFALGRASGGFGPDPDHEDTVRASQVRFILRPDFMRLGATYWVATASRSDPRYPQGLAGVWAEDSTMLTPLFESAIREDAYAWWPVLWRPGWTLGWHDPKGGGPTRARVWRQGRLLWERELEGRLAGDVYMGWDGWEARKLGEGRPMGIPDSALVLIAAVRVQMARGNRFDLPEGRALIHEYRDLWSGRRVASQATVETAAGLTCFQTYDRRGRMAFERVTEYLRSGGEAVGAPEEHWLRQVERSFDPRTARVLREVVSRYGALPRGSASSWIPVDRDSAYRAAPLKRAYLLAGR